MQENRRASFDGQCSDIYHNAMVESFFASLECELIERCPWKNKTEARAAYIYLDRILVQPTLAGILY